MKALKILVGLLALSILLIISFNFLLTSDNFFQQQLSKHGSYDRVDNANQINKAVLQYLTSETPSLQVENFNEREETHLSDVKDVFKQLNDLMIVAFFLLIALIAFLIRKEQSFRNLCFETSKICLIILLVAAIFSIVSFSFLFTSFHQVFFESGTWLFNNNDLLIKLYPNDFFNDFFQNILILTVLYNLILLVASKPK